jgi:hypothetical protein
MLLSGGSIHTRSKAIRLAQLMTGAAAQSTVQSKEQLLQLGNGLIGIQDGMPNRPRVLKDLVVVATLERLVAEEVDGGEVDAVG